MLEMLVGKTVVYVNVMFLLCNILLLYTAVTYYSSYNTSQQQQPQHVITQQHEPTLTKNRNESRYIFVDLGANSADSFKAFLQENRTKFKYDYPKPEGKNHSDAEVYLFEANPYFTPILAKAKQWAIYERVPPIAIVEIFPCTAVWIEDGTVTFYLDTINPGSEFWGSSLDINAPDVKKSKFANVSLTSIDISRWLIMNFLPRDYVVVKMDIEGAELQVVERILELKVTSVIDVLLVEIHKSVSKAIAPFMEKLKKAGVLAPAYDTRAR